MAVKFCKTCGNLIDNSSLRTVCYNCVSEAQESATETLLNALDPSVNPAKDATHFRRIIAARQRVTDAERELYYEVYQARRAGESWGVIGMAHGLSKQAAKEKYDDLFKDWDSV